MTWTAEDVLKILANPIYVGMGPYSPTMTKEQWIQSAAKAIKEVGEEKFFLVMIENLREAFEPGAAPYGYKKEPKPTPR